MSTQAIKKAISIAGSQSKLARKLGLIQPYVWKWLNRDKKVPPEFAIRIEKVLEGRVTRHELRPDLYPLD